jgi:hypothetical protein
VLALLEKPALRIPDRSARLLRRGVANNPQAVAPLTAFALAVDHRALAAAPCSPAAPGMDANTDVLLARRRWLR